MAAERLHLPVASPVEPRSALRAAKVDRSRLTCVAYGQDETHVNDEQGTVGRGLRFFHEATSSATIATPHP
jgi:hypothetical protein